MPLKTLAEDFSYVKDRFVYLKDFLSIVLNDLLHPFRDLKATEGAFDMPPDSLFEELDAEETSPYGTEPVSEEDNSLIRTREGLGEEQLEQIIKNVMIESPSITFDEIGGQTKAKEELKFLAYSISCPYLYKKWGTRPPKGVLLYGDPGNGKTMLAKALATEADAAFYNISLTDFIGVWSNESELILQYILNHAKENAKERKAILFFDEFDSVGTNRRLLYKEPWSARITSLLASNMDGMQENNLMYMASTNNLEFIDPALLRPGRFDRIIEVNYPSYCDRKEIIEIQMSKARKIAEREIYHAVDVDLIADEMIGFSGADIAEIMRRASEQKVRQEAKQEGTVFPITTINILEQIERYERKRYANG